MRQPQLAVTADSVPGGANAGFLSPPDVSERQVFPASLSSDEVVGLSQSQLSLSRSSTLPYDHAPQRAQPQHGLRPKARPRSPGSQMVTLEEFLQESNDQSPLVVTKQELGEVITVNENKQKN